MQALHKICVTYFLVVPGELLDEQSAWREVRTIPHTRLRNGLPCDRNNGDTLGAEDLLQLDSTASFGALIASLLASVYVEPHARQEAKPTGSTSFLLQHSSGLNPRSPPLISPAIYPRAV